jgi:Ca2+-binding RTX toxin-like protein
MILVTAGVASLATAAPSFAGTVSSSSGDVRYDAAAGETNNVTVDLSGGTYTITDTGPGVSVTATAPCTQTSSTTAQCPQTPAASVDHFTIFDHVTVTGNDLNDTITVNAMPLDGTRIDGGTGNDTIVGSAGPDKITGGADDDVIDPNDVVTPVNMDPNSVDPVCDPDPFFSDLSIVNCPDIIDGGSVDGGIGFNTLRFDHKPNGVTIDAGTKGPDPKSVIDPTRPRNGDTRANLLAIAGTGWRFNKFVGTPGADQIIGTAEDDTLVGRGGPDVLCGGPGNDTVDYSGSGEAVTVSLDTAIPPDPKWDGPAEQQARVRTDCRQTTTTTGVDDTLPKDCVANDGGPADGPPNARDCVGVDTENIIGSPFNDYLKGNSPGKYVARAAFFEPRGENVLDGGGGNDVLDGLLGADVLKGGDGNDTVGYATETLPVKVTLDGAANDGSSADQNPDSGKGDSVGTDVENIVGGQGNDTLIGSVAGNGIWGGPGNDNLQGGGGPDTLNGEGGDDYLQGQDSTDVLNGGPGNDTLDGGLGKDTLNGDEGVDAVDYSNNTTSVVATPDGVANDGNNGGAEGDNVGNTIESLFGGSGSDTLVGNDGNGVIDGGPGNDTLDGGGGSDLIVGGAGIDNASYAGRSEPITANLAAPGADGAAGENDNLQQIEQVTGGNGNDTITGNDAVNILSGGPGNDTLDGGGADDQIFGGDGNDTLAGGAGNDTLSGDAGDDNLQGGDGADGLNGGDGNDQLDGGAAADILTGGPGDDTAVYSARTKAVDVTLDGADNDGEASEKDQIRVTVESTKTGAGDDSINVRDGIKGEVSCGRGRDVVTADAVDTVANDCEVKNVPALATCSVRSGSVTMSKTGVIRIRVTCPSAGKGKLTLQTSGAYKAKKTRKKLKLGSKSFSVKAGKATTVKVKLSKKARRLVKKNKRLRARATLTVKGAKAAKATKRTKTLTIKAPKKKR